MRWRTVFLVTLSGILSLWLPAASAQQRYEKADAQGQYQLGQNYLTPSPPMLGIALRRQEEIAAASQQ
jgi:hypothetical protein